MLAGGAGTLPTPRRGKIGWEVGRGPRLGGEPVALWFLINRTVPQPAQGNEQLARGSRKKPWLTESSSLAVQADSLSGFHRRLGTRMFFWVLVCLRVVFGFFFNK